MSFVDKLQRAREVLEQQGRLSVRALVRELELPAEEVGEIIEELVDVQQVAERVGSVLIWRGAGVGASRPEPSAELRTPRPAPGSAAAASHGEARKVVTILFADLAGSTALHERLDPESVRAFMESYYRAMRAEVEAHGGVVVKLLGDGVMAAFGVPQVAEDDALRAARAAVAMQRAFDRLFEIVGKPGDIGLRIAVNTGEVVVSGDNSDVVGDPVNVAARLQQEAGVGEVVVGAATQRLVGTLITLEPLSGGAGCVDAGRAGDRRSPMGRAVAARSRRASGAVGRQCSAAGAHRGASGAARRACVADFAGWLRGGRSGDVVSFVSLFTVVSLNGGSA